MVAAVPDFFERSSLTFEHSGTDSLDVRQFSVHESLSTLFTIQLLVRCSNPDLDLSEIVGRPATFKMQRARSLTASAKRQWSGIVSNMEQVQAEEDGLSTYTLTLVPELWLLTQRKNYRIFQQVSEPDIVLTVLKDWGIEPELRIDKSSYKERRYRVQYGETDFAFVSRMLEDVGITYLFETRDGETKLVLSDEPQKAKAVPPIQYISTPTDKLETEFVTAVSRSQQVRPGVYTMRDHDYRRPPEFKLVASANEGQGIEQKLERFQYVPGAFLFRGEGDGATPTADDRGAVRADLEEGKKQAQRRLDAKRGNARVVTFLTSATSLGPGTVFSMIGHQRADLAPDKTLLIVSASISGGSNDAWSHSCEARFTDMAFRPPVATPKPRTQGMESATVVGPKGEEIHTDEFGRVRVHFHWDRESQMDDKSSCWIHVSQSWGGGSFGGMNLPRIGQEVLIDFLGGDPDRPVVVGRVYTNTQKVPYQLPKYKMVSSLRSETTPRTQDPPEAPATPSALSSVLGSGVPMVMDVIDQVLSKSKHFQAQSPNKQAHKWKGSEVTLDDSKGKEKLYIQAQKDLNVVVKNASTSVVGNHQACIVGTDDILNVKNKQAISVGVDRAVTVGNNQVHVVKNNVTQQSVEGNQLFLTKEDFTTIAKKHLVQSDEIIVLRVGTSSITMAKNYIVIQADDVFINPGQAAAAAAMEGTRPETSQEREAAAKKAEEERKAAEAAAAREQRLQQSRQWINDFRQSMPGIPVYPSDALGRPNQNFLLRNHLAANGMTDPAEQSEAISRYWSTPPSGQLDSQ